MVTLFVKSTLFSLCIKKDIAALLSLNGKNSFVKAGFVLHSGRLKCSAKLQKQGQPVHNTATEREPNKGANIPTITTYKKELDKQRTRKQMRDGVRNYL